MRFSAIVYMPFCLLLCAATAGGQPFPPLEKGDELVPPVAPVIRRATAAEVDGEVVIRLLVPGARMTKKKDADGVTVIVLVWKERPPLTFGKEVQAYSQGGKPMSKDAVLQALRKETPVVCFMRSKPDDPEQPDPFYAGMFRDNVVLLVFKHDGSSR